MTSSTTEDQVLAAALSLDATARGRVAEQLLASLESPPLSPAWVDEIDRRVATLRAGRASTVTADAAFQSAREKLVP